MTHFIPTKFDSLTDEQVGVIQALRLDQKVRVTQLAATYDVSESTIYKALRAVPAHLVHINELAVKRWRGKCRRTA